MNAAAVKELKLATKAAGTGQPDANELAAIRKHHLREFTADQLYVRTVVLAHNAIDRDNEVFDEAFLAKMAATLKGKGLFEVHPLGWDGGQGMPEGLWFDANVETMSFDDARKMLNEPGLQFPPDRTTASVLFGKFYVPVMAANEALRTKVDAGLGFASLGFRATRRDPIKDTAGRELEARRIGGDGEALEASLVWLGAQPGARAIKSATQRGATVDLKTAILGVLGLAAAATDDQVLAKVNEIKAAGAASPAVDPKVGKYDAAFKALGADGALLDTPEKLVAQLADAKSFRASLVDDLLTAERTTGRIKADSDDQLKAWRDTYTAMPTAQLKLLRDAAVAAVPAGAIAPSNPGAAVTPPTTPTTKAATPSALPVL